MSGRWAAGPVTDPIRATEPVTVLTNAAGEHIAVPASVADGIAWSMRKWVLMRERNIGSDEAEAIVRQEMAAQPAE